MTQTPRSPPVLLLLALFLTGVAALWSLLRSAGIFLSLLASQADFTSLFPKAESALWATWAFYIVIPGLWGLVMLVGALSVAGRRPGSLQNLQAGLWFAMIVVIGQGFVPSLWLSAVGNVSPPKGAILAYWVYKGFQLAYLGGILFCIRLPQSREYVAPTLGEDDLPYHYRLG